MEQEQDVKVYLVGGSVRDRLMGVRSKDIDYACEAPSFERLVEYVKERGGTVFLEKPEFVTVRAKLNGIDADFTLCRKEANYSDGRRPDSVEPGTLMEDLKRRDFTVNAIAFDEETGDFIDPFNGRLDISKKLLRCVGEARERFTEDSLRLLRALRFSITKGFVLDQSIKNCLHNKELIETLDNAKMERWYQELKRCFEHDTPLTLTTLEAFPLVKQKVFRSGKLWLLPTMKET